MSGSLSLDPTQLFRFRIRFTPAECTELGQVNEVAREPPNSAKYAPATRFTRDSAWRSFTASMWAT